MDIVVSALAGGVMGGIVAVILTLGLLRRDRRIRRAEGKVHEATPSGTWRAAAGPLFRRLTRRSAAAQSGAPSEWTGRVITPPAPSPTRGPFDRFNDSAKRVLALAQDEAIRFNHNYIGTEHILLGLVREDGLASRLLHEAGVELEKVRKAVGFVIGRGDAPTTPAEITMSPRTKKVIELAIDEARRLNHALVGSEHLLLGLLREGEGIASGVLESLGVSLEKMRGQLYAVLGQPAPPPAERAYPPGAFGWFSSNSKRLLALSQDEAVRMNHNYIGTEHLILGLGRLTEGGVVDETLKNIYAELGLALPQLREAVGKIVPRGSGATSPSEITLSPATKKAMDLAHEEMSTRKERELEPVHLLLGVVRQSESIGAAVLAQFGATADRVREVVDRGLAG